MLSRTDSLGQAQLGVLGHPGAGCPPALLQAGTGRGGCRVGPYHHRWPVGIQSMDPAGGRV